MKGGESMKNMTESEYRQLVEEYSDMVTRLCVVHTGNFSDAEDCYQNVFFKLFKQMKKAVCQTRKRGSSEWLSTNAGVFCGIV